MAEIKDIGKIKEKWTRVTPMRAEDYKLGVKDPKRDWEKQAIAQKEIWKGAITEAAAKDMYAKGITAAGTVKWQEKALTKGPGRFSEGVMVAGPDFEKGFAPYAEIIRSTVLPPRFPKGDPRNYTRVQTIGTALRAKKVGK